MAAIAVAVALALAASGAPGGFSLDPSRFSAHVDNPWFPLRPGTTYVYRGVKDGKPARDVLTVTHEIERIAGVPCVVVKDRLYLSGHLEERTTDWYTQDRSGNVWYLGEQTAELDRHGKVTTTEGTWQTGKDGARPGVYMPASPKVGQVGQQEHYKGHAEDRFRVLRLHARVRVPYTSSSRALLTA
jgi:hypothetical protein